METANAAHSLLSLIMEENPTLFYDTSEFEDLDDYEETIETDE